MTALQFRGTVHILDPSTRRDFFKSGEFLVREVHLRSHEAQTSTLKSVISILVRIFQRNVSKVVRTLLTLHKNIEILTSIEIPDLGVDACASHERRCTSRTKNSPDLKRSRRVDRPSVF